MSEQGLFRVVAYLVFFYSPVEHDPLKKYLSVPTCM